VALADLGDSGNLFQRNAAREPLHAQIFAKITHRLPEKYEPPWNLTFTINPHCAGVKTIWLQFDNCSFVDRPLLAEGQCRERAFERADTLKAGANSKAPRTRLENE
jgi:hypothetical protein